LPSEEAESDTTPRKLSTPNQYTKRNILVYEEKNILVYEEEKLRMLVYEEKK